MTYTVEIKVMLLKDLLDPQGKAVMVGLKNLSINNISNVRIGKYIVLKVEAETEVAARAVADEAAKKLLSNTVMEHYEIEVVNAK